LDRRVFLLPRIEPLFFSMHSEEKNSKFKIKIFTQTYLLFWGVGVGERGPFRQIENFPAKSISTVSVRLANFNPQEGHMIL
jgi:hypothetical protein